MGFLVNSAAGENLFLCAYIYLAEFRLIEIEGLEKGQIKKIYVIHIKQVEKMFSQNS